MKRYTVEFMTAAQEDLVSLHKWVADSSSLNRADAFLAAILRECESLQYLPNRGVLGSDGIRRIGIVRGRCFVRFLVESDRVIIFGVGYAGRQY